MGVDMSNPPASRTKDYFASPALSLSLAGIFRDGAAAAANMEVEEGDEGSGGGAGRREETVEISSENSGHARSRSVEEDFDGDGENDGDEDGDGDKNKKKKRKKYHRHTAEQIREMEAGGEAEESSTLVPAILTFGDSAVDVGNNDYLPTIFKANYPPYGRDFTNHKPTGRFCNGKLATDITAYLSPQASGKNLLIGANFASAAASGFDDKPAILNHAIPLSQQLQYYKEYQAKLAKVAGNKKAASIIKDGLYILSAGSSDFVQNYYVNPLLNKVYTPDQYSSYLVGIFSRLVQVGSQKNWGDFTATTGLSSGSHYPVWVPQKRVRLQNQHRCSGIQQEDQILLQQLSRSSFPGLKIAVFDIFKPLYDVVRTPSKYGFTEAMKGCCGTGTVETTSLLCNPKSPGTCSNATKYVFWDSVHPSEAANKVLADSLIIQGIDLIG
ncbi:GDSL-like Lipase/Acylhydrolase superfamily protein [Actinidia rufa]|uniref:GDSL-like Lipase/Acylhydrolase superfamily protein n=1 Tax=Actinidia rufa TaxID=165716 RepID=A0A7J0GBE4_9ERIC|nr:GDSL-like Lipase/Acylhydrolase superfamily protein [Actinidia rufa]